MNLVARNINLDIEDNTVACEYSYNAVQSTKWQLNLLDDKIIYVENGKEKNYLVNDIKELEFEIETGNTRGKPHTSDIAIAYIVLKNDSDPCELFSLIAWQEDFALSSKTNSYHFCEEIIKFIGTKYSIPWTYKLSIETKKKSNRLGLIVLILILQLILALLLLYKK